jgi:arginyl-tRNA synthetase
MKEKIRNLISEALEKLDLSAADFSVERPEDSANGDYSANIAMVLAKELGENPREFAEKIIYNIKNLLARKDLASAGEIEKIEVAGPGFINFYLSRKFFSDRIAEILEKKENYGKNKNLAGKKVMVEYTDPNPFKEFHIGHLMSNTIGEAVARLMEASGAEVKRACYQGDVGMHVAKAIWGYQKQKDWKTAYAFGSKSYEEDDGVKREVLEINKRLYARSDQELNKIYDEGKKASLENFEEIYRKLGTSFNYYFFESEAAKLGKQVVEENLRGSAGAGGIFEKGEKGAVVFRAENFNKKLHTRVFINSEGIPTYEAKELGLAKMKHDKFPYDKSIVITGSEVDQYFRVLFEAMKHVFPELAEKTRHVSHGMLRLPSGKMSSRTGDVITAESLLSMISEKVVEKVEETNRGEMNEEFIDQVAVAALKYSVLKQSAGSDIVYDFEKSISFEGDSGPYLQYSYARARSVAEKAEKEEIFMSVEDAPAEISGPERLLHIFPEVVERAAEEFQPHHITGYLIELARAFNAYYGSTRIAEKGDPGSPYKVALAGAFATVIKNGLRLLGIQAPEKM